MLSWQKLQMEQTLKAMRATKIKIFGMVDKGIPDIGDMLIIHMALEACIMRLERVMEVESPIDEAALKRGE